MTGIISFAGDDDRFVVQTLHVLQEGDHRRPRKAAADRVTRPVFIGRDLPRDVISDGFAKCRAVRQAAG